MKTTNLRTGIPLLLAAACALAALTASAEQKAPEASAEKEGNGQFAYRRLRYHLESNVNYFVKKLESLPEGAFLAMGVANGDLIRALRYENLDQRPGEMRFRENDPRPLALDYDLGRWQITLLAPFYQTYANYPERFEAMNATDTRIIHELLHEAAHLFGRREAFADAFADEILNRLKELDKAFVRLIVHGKVKVDQARIIGNFEVPTKVVPASSKAIPQGFTMVDLSEKIARHSFETLLWRTPLGTFCDSRKKFTMDVIYSRDPEHRDVISRVSGAGKSGMIHEIKCDGARHYKTDHLTP